MRSVGRTNDDFKPVRKVAVPEGLEDVTAMIDEQVQSNPVMLYMKGTPARPQCGFSMQAVRILNAIGVEFSSGTLFDCIKDSSFSCRIYLYTIIILSVCILCGRKDLS